jgi:hypothetical protein
MNFRLIPRLFVLLVSCEMGLFASEPAGERKVLFIGNSMIGGATPRHLHGFVRAAGGTWTIESLLKAGGDLRETAYGKGLPVPERIRGGNWTEVVFVQGTAYWFDQMTTEAQKTRNADQTIEASLTLHRLIAAQGARTVVFMSYPHQPEPDRRNYAGIEAVHWRQKTRLDAEAVEGKRSATLLVPIGPLWIRGAGKFGEDTWYKNERHGNEIAYYASACLFYTYLTGQDPRPLSYNGPLLPEDAAWIRSQAWDLFTNYRPPQ